MAVTTKVGFLVAGAQKSGTSALDLYLRGHPELCLARQKEVHFFDTDRHFAANPVDYGVYHAWFSPKPSHRLLGEVTPAYMSWPEAPTRIARYNPAMKIIMALRNPVTRAYSQWNMARQSRREPLGFLDALKVESERMRVMPPVIARRFTYVDRGRYVKQLRRMWGHIPREQTMVIRSEDLLRSPVTVLASVAEFLDIAPFPPIEDKTVHAREYDTTMTDEERRYLVSVFDPEIRELERLLGWNLAAWLE